MYFPHGLVKHRDDFIVKNGDELYFIAVSWNVAP
jgi:hypothetical protein